jgi:hypothetical protein
MIGNDYRGALMRVLEGDAASSFAPTIEIIDHDLDTGVFEWESVRLSLCVVRVAGAHPGLGFSDLFATLAERPLFRFEGCGGSLRARSFEGSTVSTPNLTRWSRIIDTTWALMPLPTPALESPSAESSFEGLFTGSYGPHGTEVIHITLISSEEREDAPPVSARQFIDSLFDTISDYSPPDEDGPPTREIGSDLNGGIFGRGFDAWKETMPVSEFLRRGPVLVGRKVSGDANVPSGQVSFIGSLHDQSRMTVEEVLLLCHPEIRDHERLRELLARMTHACVGAMQINVDPENWRPEYELALLIFQRDGSVMVLIVNRVAGGVVPNHGIMFRRVA